MPSMVEEAEVFRTFTVNSFRTCETFSCETSEGETVREREAINWVDSGSCARANRHRSGMDTCWLPESRRGPAAAEKGEFAMTKRLPKDAVRNFSETTPETVFLGANAYRTGLSQTAKPLFYGSFLG